MACEGSCEWIYSGGAWVLVSSTCTAECAACQTPTVPGVENEALIEFCVYPCGGNCWYTWSDASQTWTMTGNNCAEPSTPGCECGPEPGYAGLYDGQAVSVNCEDSAGTTTTTTPACASSCIYIYTSGAWLNISDNCDIGCFCWTPTEIAIEGAVVAEPCRGYVQPTTTSTTTTPICENSSCTFIWMSGVWVSVAICMEGCTCLMPSYDGTDEGEEATTSCVGTSTTSTTTTPGECEFQTCVYRWDGSEWVSALECPIDCYCGSPPARAGAFLNEYVSANCQSTLPTTTTTTTAAPTTTTTTTGTTSTTTTPCAGRCCIRDVYYDNGLTYSEIVTDDCIGACNCNLPDQPAYPFSIPTQWRMYASCGETSYPQITTTTSTAPPCTGTCTWRWSAVSSQWIPYGASGSYPEWNKCRSAVQIGSYFYLQKCSCIYPETPGTVDGEITTNDCGTIDCDACACSDRWWCDDTGVSMRRPETLTVTFHDDDNVWPCMDGVTLTLIRPPQTNLSGIAYMLGAMVEVPACAPSIFDSTSGDPIRFRCDTACGGVPGYHGTSAAVPKTLWITNFDIYQKSAGYGYRVRTSGGYEFTPIHNNCLCGDETIIKKSFEFGVYARIGTYMRAGANGAISNMCSVEPMVAFSSSCGSFNPFAGDCVFDSCDPVSYSGSFSVSEFVSFLAGVSGEFYSINYGATAGTIYYTITE